MWNGGLIKCWIGNFLCFVRVSYWGVCVWGGGRFYNIRLNNTESYSGYFEGCFEKLHFSCHKSRTKNVEATSVSIGGGGGGVSPDPKPPYLRVFARKSPTGVSHPKILIRGLGSRVPHRGLCHLHSPLGVSAPTSPPGLLYPETY